MTAETVRDTFAELQGFVERQMPRLLSQGCRDPLSPEHGCFDRNWWHYKIRDFPSIILQQAGYTAWEARALPAFARHEGALRALAAATCRFWQERALRSGAFEEYYPWEQGYPPLAFSTLAILKLVDDGVVPTEELRPGAAVAARQLRERFEPQAANQQVAGLAALAWLRRVYPDLVPGEDFARQSARTLALQDGEGWYMEYDGPDLGYLSVTLDCLWDLFDATGDKAYVDSARGALAYLHAMVAAAGVGPGMHNARNTDYILPYGMLRFVRDGEPDDAHRALDSFRLLYEGLSAPSHFVHAIDDRYLCHYAGHSLVRALRFADAAAAAASVLEAAPLPELGDAYYANSGHALVQKGEARYLLSLRKGGILSGRTARGHFADFGWTVRAGGELLVTHWWSPHWEPARGDDGDYRVAGALVPHKFAGSSPTKHAALRGASRLLGPRLIGPLKRRLIFQSRLSSIRTIRTVTLRTDGADIVDRFEGLPDDATLERSPRSSKRHVASADSFHDEDFALLVGVERREHRSGRDGARSIMTSYRFAEAR